MRTKWRKRLVTRKTIAKQVSEDYKGYTNVPTSAVLFFLTLMLHALPLSGLSALDDRFAEERAHLLDACLLYTSPSPRDS